ncbi:MAG: glutathione S-transferase family protein [Solirubrobacterales bacterium]
MNADKPVLWHIPISHYNEKARWALAYKGIEHERRAPVPGAHMVVALALTRGRSATFPVLQLGGRTYGESTDIIAALEELVPDPPLYPDDPARRARALELEDFFDEELGPHIRLYAYNELLREPEAFERVAEKLAPAPLRRFAGPMAAALVKVRFRVSDEGRARVAKEKVLAALDRLEGELGGSSYLVGDAFSVADLTAASLFYPLVAPPEGPEVEVTATGFEEFRAPLRERTGFRWVEEMFARHRRPPAPS